MTLKDRTDEFISIVQNAKSKKPVVTKNTPKRVQKSDFSTIATQIGMDIASTSEKLERLTKLAKKKSLFDDPSVEIQELTVVINQDIKNITSQIAVLQQHKDTVRKNKQVESHTDTVVNTLRSKLQKTTKGFSEVLEVRTENLKTQQKERETFTGSQLESLGRRTAESPLYRPTTPEISEISSSGEVAITMPQQSLLLTQDRYITGRAEAVMSIEKTITELQSIFRQLATLVAEQQEQIERIDHDIDMTGSHVDGAQNALIKFYNNLSNNRWLMIKLFFVLLFFAVIFIVFFV